MNAPERDRDKPDVAGARERLARVREQRERVEQLVGRLASEERLNNFLANAEVVFRGGR